jgi:hypothetical protein
LPVRHGFRPLLLILFAVLLPASVPQGRPAVAQGVITYRKVFKSSSPEYTEIRVPESGAGSCDLRGLDDPPDPQAFDIGTTLRSKIFELAGELHFFRGLDLDLKRRIANLGQKTFRYERGGEASEVRFNYTLDSRANLLLQIFEGLARAQEHFSILQRRMKYDRLGVNEALQQLDQDLHHQVIPEPERFLPLLEQIANDAKFVDIARQRARAMADSIRKPLR